MVDWAKFIEAKIGLAKRGLMASPQNDAARIPPGQRTVTNFPVLDLGTRPKVPRSEWRLRIFGLVKKQVDLDWAAFAEIQNATVMADFHCVTRWSKLDMAWQGVRAKDVLDLAEPLAEARFATLHSYDDYTTNVPIAALVSDSALLAHSVDGKRLSREHGGPVRMVIPALYGWKSAKWIKAIELHEQDRPGFWEVRGYHNDADPWREQRFSGPHNDP